MAEKRMEDFFLKTIHRISLIGVLLIVIMDMVFMPKDNFLGVGGFVDIGILMNIAFAMFLHKKGFYLPAIIIPTSFSAVALIIISVLHSKSYNTAMIALVAVGFSISILLKSKIRNWMHLFIILGMTIVLLFHLSNYSFYMYENSNQVITNFGAYYIVYLIITFSASTLKDKYDTVTLELQQKNLKLLEQTVLMAHQNNELVESKNALNEINQNLESIVEQRTNNVKQKNEYLLRYAFTNAHHVRGPLARILGLLQLAKLDEEVDYPFLFGKIEEQSKEIDVVLKNINKELEEGQDIFF